MKLPRFSIRELFMLTAIVALSLPYVRRARTPPPLDLSYGNVAAMVIAIEPKAMIQSGGGGMEDAEVNCLVPKATSDTFTRRFHELIKKRIAKSGWTQTGSGTSTSNGMLTAFSIDLSRGSNRCCIRFHLLDKKEGTDVINQTEVERIRFVLLSPKVR